MSKYAKKAARAVGLPVATAAPSILIGIPAAASMLSCSVWAVRELIWARKIQFVKIGRRFLLDPEDLRAYVEKNKAVAS